jgi:hypothetical protein
MIQEFFEQVNWFRDFFYTHIFNANFRKHITMLLILDHSPLKTLQCFKVLFTYISKNNQLFLENFGISVCYIISPPKLIVIF